MPSSAHTTYILRLSYGNCPRWPRHDDIAATVGQASGGQLRSSRSELLASLDLAVGLSFGAGGGAREEDDDEDDHSVGECVDGEQDMYEGEDGVDESETDGVAGSRPGSSSSVRTSGADVASGQWAEYIGAAADSPPPTAGSTAESAAAPRRSWQQERQRQDEAAEHEAAEDEEEGEESGDGSGHPTDPAYTGPPLATGWAPHWDEEFRRSAFCRQSSLCFALRIRRFESGPPPRRGPSAVWHLPVPAFPHAFASLSSLPLATALPPRRFYFYHAETGDSTWQAPTPLPPPKPAAPPPLQAASAGASCGM